jgi:pilus assembly protein TadC
MKFLIDELEREKPRYLLIWAVLTFLQVLFWCAVIGGVVGVLIWAL